MEGTPPNTDNDFPDNVPLMEILAYVKVAEHYVPMRVLLDNGADRSYISKEFVNKHCIRTEALHISQRFNVEAAFGQKEHVHQRTAPIPFRIGDHFEEPTRFNIACLKSFDAIVGLDWLYQHDAAIFVRSRKLQWTYKKRLFEVVVGDLPAEPEPRVQSMQSSTEATAPPTSANDEFAHTSDAGRPTTPAAAPQFNDGATNAPLSANQFRKYCRRNRKDLEGIRIFFIQTDDTIAHTTTPVDTTPPTPDMTPAQKEAQHSRAAPRTKAQQRRLEEILLRHRRVFEPPTAESAKCKITHEIHLLPGSKAPNTAPYRLTPQMYDELKAKIELYLQKGWIRPSTSPFGSPVLFAPKKDGTWRFCCDFRALNKITIRDTYPMPDVQHLFDELSRAKVFTKLDAADGYHQIPI
jgi:hypothetical protein